MILKYQSDFDLVEKAKPEQLLITDSEQIKLLNESLILAQDERWRRA
jgi:hypothetical protein